MSDVTQRKKKTVATRMSAAAISPILMRYMCFLGLAGVK
jgi:hypothetical protein